MASVFKRYSRSRKNLAHEMNYEKKMQTKFVHILNDNLTKSLLFIYECYIDVHVCNGYVCEVI